MESTGLINSWLPYVEISSTPKRDFADAMIDAWGKNMLISAVTEPVDLKMDKRIFEDFVHIFIFLWLCNMDRADDETRKRFGRCRAWLLDYLGREPNVAVAPSDEEFAKFLKEVVGGGND